MKEKNNVKINRKDQNVNYIRFGNEEYISLTDLARLAGSNEPDFTIQVWLRNKDVITYLGLWEKLNNPSFNYN